jgi:hypothetical protein
MMQIRILSGGDDDGLVDQAEDYPRDLTLILLVACALSCAIMIAIAVALWRLL